MKFVHNDYLGGLIILILFTGVIIAIELWTRLSKPPAELSRKAVHISGGLGCLLFPFLIESPLVVTALAFIFSTSFFIGQKKGFLRSLTNVGRQSRGSEYYPFSISFIFFVSQGRLWLYFTSVLILTISDAAAALIGKKFGKIKYKVIDDEKKSLEGSLVFFMMTWLITSAILIYLAAVPLEKSILCAFLMAVLLTGTEAISVGGTDNLFVPILTCYVLLKITTKPLPEVVFQCVSMAVLFVILLSLIHYQKIFTIRDSIIFSLFTYAAWSLGSMDWALPIIITFLMYYFTRVQFKTSSQYQIETPALLQVISVPLGILILANTFRDWRTFYGPYLIATILSFILGSLVYLLHNEKIKEDRRSFNITIFGFFSALVITALINLFLNKFLWLESFFIITLCVILSLTFDYYFKKSRLSLAELGARTIWIMALFASLTYYIFQSIGILTFWIENYHV